MADLFASRVPIRLNDGTADTNNAAIANAIPSSSDYALAVRQVGLPAAAALADNTGNPTTTGIGAYLFGYDGTNWDRLPGTSADGLLVNLGANNDVTVTGSVTADTELTTADLDTGGGTDTRAVVGLVLAASGGALLVGTANPMPVSDNGGSLTVDGTVAISGSVTVDSELPAAAALSDNFANPTTPVVGAAAMVFDGSTWDRQIQVVAALDSAGAGIPAVGIVGQFDDAATAAVTENQFAPVRISTRRALLVEGVASGTAIPVSIGATVTVDTELPAAAALADNTANPTVPGVGAFLMGWDATNWDRISAVGGRLQVDVISGASAVPPSEVPTGYDLVSLYGTAASVSAGGVATAVVTNTPANGKDVYVRQVSVKASGQTKWQVKFGATVLWTGFNPQSELDRTERFDPPLTLTGDGSTALTVDVTNREASAQDVYAALRGIVEQ
jgi:hypothetical protein